MKTLKRKIFDFGKIAYTNPKRKSNPVTVTVELRELEHGGKELSICGEIWNHIKSDIYCGGQCLDTIAKYKKGNALFKEIYYLWKNYHLNGMKAGTKKQSDFLEKYFSENGKRYDYDEACKVLKENGLYVDKLAEGEILNHVDVERNITPENYPYGHGWIYRTIPEKDMERIEKLFNV